MNYKLFTDGACSGNGSTESRGGWAYLIKRDDMPGFSMEQAGHVDRTTNNRMELTAIIEGLRSIEPRASVEIITDSEYAIKVANSKSKKLLNLDLIHELRALLAVLDYKFTWVRGHNGHPENTHVDKLASLAAKGKIGLASVSR